MAETKHPLITKIIIKGMVECLTGLHIGTLSEQFAIGGIDSPVIKNPLTGEPYIPGSSLKGKLRSLTERALNKSLVTPQRGKKIRMHWCTDRKDAEVCEVCRLFGYVPVGSGESDDDKMPSSLYMRDLPLQNGEEIARQITSPLKFTEWKTENALDRITAASNPRDIERVPSGARFNLEVVYDIGDRNAGHFAGDLNTLVSSFCLLEDDCLGGHGSRGYGQVALFINTVTARKIRYYYAIEDGQRQSSQLLREFTKSPVSKFKAELGGFVKDLESHGFAQADD